MTEVFVRARVIFNKGLFIYIFSPDKLFLGDKLKKGNLVEVFLSEKRYICRVIDDRTLYVPKSLNSKADYEFLKSFNKKFLISLKVKV